MFDDLVIARDSPLLLTVIDCDTEVRGSTDNDDLDDQLRRFESVAEFERIVKDIRTRHGTRRDPRPTAEVKVPNGPVEYW